MKKISIGADSGLVRRLAGCEFDDPVKARARAWLADMDDEELLRFGLTPKDINILRKSAKAV